MNVEDLIIVLSLDLTANLNKWDSQLILSFADQASQGRGLTEKQATLALKILKRHSASLSAHFRTDIVQYLANPTYRYPFRQINNAKKVEFADDTVFGKVIKVQFPYNENYVNIIRRQKEHLGHAVWDGDQKSWIFSATEPNIRFLTNLIAGENFEVDEEFKKYTTQSIKILEDIESHAPMLVVRDKTLKFVNIPKNIPELTTTDMLEALFIARRYGIFIWDDTFSDFVDSDMVSPIVRTFLKTDPSEKFHIDIKKTPISDLEVFVKYLGPCVFVIPGGSELEKLQLSYDFLKSIDIDNSEMSVMFRLPSESHKKFNDFVKENKLNSPITEKTKVVFISSKLPKPLVKSKVKFNSVINLGFGGVHYSIKNFVENHENLIFYTDKKTQRELDFVIL